MAKQIKQIRWFKDGDSRNFPSTILKKELQLDENNPTDSYFEQYSPILQLSVHTLPGVKIYFNSQDKNPIYVGHSGVYQLDLTDTSAVLYGLHFDEKDLTDIENTNVGLIIDLMYNNEAEDDSEMETETIITSTGGKASISVDTHIKNIHKNIWYGVTDKISPYIMERDSKLEKLKAEFASIINNLKNRYKDILSQLDMSSSSYAEQFANCQACYARCLREIIDYYEEAIRKLTNNLEVNPMALKELLEKITETFNNLDVSMIQTEFTLEPQLTGNNIDLNDFYEQYLDRSLDEWKEILQGGEG